MSPSSVKQNSRRWKKLVSVLGCLPSAHSIAAARAAAAASAAGILQAWGGGASSGGHGHSSNGTPSCRQRAPQCSMCTIAVCQPLEHLLVREQARCTGSRDVWRDQATGGRAAAADKGAASGSGHPQPTALTVVQLHQLLHAHIAEVGRGPRGCTREAWGRQQVDRACSGGECGQQAPCDAPYPSAAPPSWWCAASRAAELHDALHKFKLGSCLRLLGRQWARDRMLPHCRR